MTERTPRPRHLAVRLLGWSLFAALLYAGGSWALIAGAGSTRAFEGRGRDRDALLDLTRRRLTVLRAARSLPGFRERAGRASRAVLKAAAKALERTLLTGRGRAKGTELGYALLTVDPRHAAGYSGKRRLCDLGQVAALSDFDTRDQSRLGGAALGAAILGQAHRSAWLQERLLAGGVEYSYLRSRSIGRLMAADYRQRAAEALRRSIAKEKHASSKETQQQQLCAQLALAGRDREAAALPRSGRCQGARAWQAALSGRHAEAARLAADLGAPGQLDHLLLKLAIHAEAGRWTELAALYRSRGGSRHSFGDAYAEVLKFFNDIYSPPVPLSLTRRLLRRVEERLAEPGAEAALSELHHRLLFVRARQLLLAGRPRRALASMRRARRIAPGYRRAQLAWPPLLALLRGPERALAALRREKLRQPLHEATYLTLLGRHREARRALTSVRRCEELCLLLKVAVARALGDKASVERLRAKAAKRGGNPNLVKRLLSRPKGRLLASWTLSNVSTSLQSKLVFMRLADPDGAQTRWWIRSSLCQLDRAPLDGTMLGIYVLEDVARRTKDTSALARLARWRRRVGLMYEHAAELWLSRVPD